MTLLIESPQFPLHTFPDPIATNVKGEIVLTWFCQCGNPLGEFSAQRAWDLHGRIVCGDCMKRERELNEALEKEYGGMTNV